MPTDERHHDHQDHTLDDPADDQPERDTTLTLDGLNTALCRAVGLDPSTIAGYRLTVMGAALPQLEVWHLPPVTDDGSFHDGWVGPLTDIAADTTSVLLPGANADVPPAVPAPDPVGPGYEVPLEYRSEVWLARHLGQVLDALNGAPLTADERDRLTTMGHRAAREMQERVWRVRTPAGQDNERGR